MFHANQLQSAFTRTWYSNPDTVVPRAISAFDRGPFGQGLVYAYHPTLGAGIRYLDVDTRVIRSEAFADSGYGPECCHGHLLLHNLVMSPQVPRLIGSKARHSW